MLKGMKFNWRTEIEIRELPLEVLMASIQNIRCRFVATKLSNLAPAIAMGISE